MGIKVVDLGDIRKQNVILFPTTCSMLDIDKMVIYPPHKRTLRSKIHTCGFLRDCQEVAVSHNDAIIYIHFSFCSILSLIAIYTTSNSFLTAIIDN